MRVGRAECIHDEHPLFECSICNAVVCSNCLEKYHGKKCAFREMDQILKNEYIGFQIVNNQRINIYPQTEEGYLVKTYRIKKLASGEKKRYGPFWERHRWDKESNKSIFVKYIGKILTEF